MPEINLVVKGTNETKFNVTVDPQTTTVVMLKEIIETLDSSISKDNQRLIYGGRILKDEELLSSYKVQDGNTIHLVKGMPGMGGMGGMNMTPEMLEAMYSNPLVQQTTQQIFSNPELLRSMIDSNPALASSMTPEMRQAMMNPEFMRAMTNPEVIRSTIQMQNAIARARTGTSPTQTTSPSQPSGNLYNPWAAPTTTDTNNQSTAPASGAPPVNPYAAFMDPSQNQAAQQMLANMLGTPWGPMGSDPNAGFGTTNTQTTQSTLPPEERYAEQLTQLNEMGFWDPQKNIRALVSTGGNVNAAVEILLRDI
ncbi:hypothetical protein BB559_000837 [Furculomyces boomerangus]|uniref:Ubiquilin n=1 Tax=Furculomyces boomerangus TaxID=61424 RepID=A0A2T9Z3Y7_9FUNG|nr:hypothetical protein BB559_000837 [Furculomyces boomerangus]